MSVTPGEKLPKKERRYVARVRRLGERALRRLRDRHDRCWYEAAARDRPWSNAGLWRFDQPWRSPL